MNIAFPFHIDARGRTAEADEDRRIRDMIEQTLFTSPGERVNRPDFGCGLRQMVFAPNSAELAATAQFLLQGALQQWLGRIIQVQAVEVAAEEEILRISVHYTVLRNQRKARADYEARP